MGQKVHPLGFRVGITKKHQSQWFARFHKNSYAQTVVEDKMLRTTLMTLFPELLNPVLKKIKTGKQEKEVTPKITQIKIERGLIPYEISIQIHAENCNLIKVAIDKLKIDRDLACYLQKARKFLGFLGENAYNSLVNNKNKATTAEIDTSFAASGAATEGSLESGVQTRKGNTTTRQKKLKRVKFNKQNSSKVSSFKKASKRFGYGKKRRPRLTKEEFKRKRLIQRRLRKRQGIRARFQNFISKGLLLSSSSSQNSNSSSALLFTRKGEGQPVKGSLLQSKKIRIFSKIKAKRTFLNRFKNRKFFKKNLRLKGRIKTFSSFVKMKNTSRLIRSTNKKTTRPVLQKKPTFYFFKKRIQKKFLNIYLKKMNKNFLKELKKIMQNWSISSLRSPQNKKAPAGTLVSSLVGFGYRNKWDLKKIKKFKTKPLSKLIKLIRVLEKKARSKMESLKKYFMIFGCLSKIQGYTFYQIMVFLKTLKNLVRQRVVRLRLGFDKKETIVSTNESNSLKNKSFQSGSAKAYGLQSLKTKKILVKVANNLDDECRKIKFIEYLKQIVKKHRTKNIFYYLSTLSKASQELKQAKNFTIKNAKFLFGLDLQKQLNKNETTSSSSTSAVEDNIIKERVSKVLEQTNQNKLNGNLDFEETLRDSLIRQIEKQKYISRQNLNLTPKISIKFYSVKKQDVEMKSSVVAASIIDSLEKRKAFRGVIKKAKEELMKKQRVKGVKIQVAGRLNGAEIARTEWVRAGRVPLQTLRANIDFSYQTAYTIYGIIGVKVWIFKGYTKTI